VRDLAQYHEARRLIAAGNSRSAVARRLDIPRSTVRNWADRPAGDSPGRRWRERSVRLPDAAPEELPDVEYAYLLGLYLGDGWIGAHRRGVFRLTISLDARYQQIIAEASLAIGKVQPANRVHVAHRPGCVAVSAYSKLWPLLFPQHGAGVKHERKIELTNWQREITHRCPRSFLRGCIHSDGCRSIARQRVGNVIYEYPRYFFGNLSDDIKRIFCEHLDLLDIAWNRPGATQIQISRRAAVAAMDEFVGPKR
jgi:hypothetical protein